MPKKKILAQTEEEGEATLNEKKSEKIAPKMLMGYLMTQYKRCGRKNCKCASGALHGPYYYRVWTINGERRKKYVPKSEFKLAVEQTSAFRRFRAKRRAELEDMQLYIAENRQRTRKIYAMMNQMIKERKR